MTSREFTEAQHRALLDLLVMATYADKHIASAEDARLQRLLTDLGYSNQVDRNRQLDKAVTRVRQHTQTVEDERTHTVSLARNFTTREQRQKVCTLLEDLMGSDGKVAPIERQFLAMAKGHSPQ